MSSDETAQRVVRKGDRYLMTYGNELYQVKAAQASKCGKYMRVRFGPYKARGKWVHRSAVIAEL